MPATTPRTRSLAAARQARRRARANDDVRIFPLPLNCRLVACALEAAGRDVDSEDFRQCIAALTQLVETACLSITRDSPDEEIRTIIAELNMRLVKRTVA